MDNKTIAYVALGGAALGALAGAFMSPSAPKRVLWGMGGLVLGGAAGAAGATLVKTAASDTKAVGAGAPPAMQLGPQLDPQAA